MTGTMFGMADARRNLLRHATDHIAKVFDCGLRELSDGIENPIHAFEAVESGRVTESCSSEALDYARMRAEMMSDLWRGRERLPIYEVAMAGLAFDEFGISHDGDEVVFDPTWRLDFTRIIRGYDATHNDTRTTTDRREPSVEMFL